MESKAESENNVYTTKTTSTANVGVRVRSYLSDIVTEMRRKSPAAVQKWVDSIPIQGNVPTTSSSSTAQKPTTSNNFLVKEEEEEEAELRDFKNNDNNGNIEKIEHSDDTEEIIGDIILDKTVEDVSNKITKDKNTNKFWNRSPLFNKKTTSGEKLGEHKIKDCEKSLANNITTFGKLKINEFYDKLSINKKRFNLIKSKRMDVKNIPDENVTDDTMIDSTGNLVSSKLINNKLQITDDDKDNNDRQYNEFDNTYQKDEISDFSHCGSSDTNEFYQYLDTKRIGIGEIGRSASENPSIIKKFRLGEIGRSFSENKNDDDDDNFIINERNNSCPNPILNSSVSSNNNFTFINPLNVSPIPRNQRLEIMSRDVSISERHRNPLLRDSSIQSDSSHCSSVESLLESRKPDPETILINLGFGPIETDNVLNKIPKRFLKPSMVKGVDTDCFVRQQKLATQVHENSVLGYRGLVGNPHIPPSSIVAKIQERFQQNENHKYINDLNMNRPISAPPPINGPNL